MSGFGGVGRHLSDTCRRAGDLWGSLSSSSHRLRNTSCISSMGQAVNTHLTHGIHPNANAPEFIEDLIFEARGSIVVQRAVYDLEHDPSSSECHTDQGRNAQDQKEVI